MKQLVSTDWLEENIDKVKKISGSNIFKLFIILI